MQRPGGRGGGVLLCSGKLGGRKREDRGRPAAHATGWTAQPLGTWEAQPRLRRKVELRLAFLRDYPWMQMESKSKGSGRQRDRLWSSQEVQGGVETRPILCPGGGWQCLDKAVMARDAAGILWAEAGGPLHTLRFTEHSAPTRPGPPSP